MNTGQPPFESEPNLVQEAAVASDRTLLLGTRRSRLARWQADHVAGLLAAAHLGLRCRQVTMSTAGDRLKDQPLPEIGSKGVFTRDIEDALRAGRIDAAVHSLKDLPTEEPPDLMIGAVCARADARDVLVSRQYASLEALPRGARVGTSSLRRAAQLRAARADLVIAPLRGNVETRIRKALDGEYEAVVIAAAGVERLDLAGHVRQALPLDVMLPAPGQGALAVQCRRDDPRVTPLLRAIDDEAARAATTAERAFLQALGGGCQAPVAAYARIEAGAGDRVLHLQAMVAAGDGSRVIRVGASGPVDRAAAVGQSAAEQALAAGAAPLLR